jgi:DNA-binding response OmpR family regulator
MSPKKLVPKRLLLVDDDEDTCELVTALLGPDGYEVVASGDQVQALELARSGDFALIVLDNWLPGRSGIQLCKKIRSFDGRTPIVFYSGAAYDTDIKEAMTAGANAYLTKPKGFEELSGTIRSLVLL